MSIKIYTSSSVETLAKEFGNLYIKQENIFNPMLVIVGANATKDWLKETIAKDKGIVANISFSNPNDCIVVLSKILGITKSTNDLLNPVQINWLLFSELGSEKFKANFPDIAKYYYGNELKRFALAEKVTSLFDKYQNLKPCLISNWNNLKTVVFVEGIAVICCIISVGNRYSQSAVDYLKDYFVKHPDYDPYS